MYIDFFTDKSDCIRNFMTSLRRGFFKKMYLLMVENTKCQLTNLESSMIELGWKLPAFRVLYKYEEFVGVKGIDAGCKIDMENFHSLVLKEHTCIQATPCDVLKAM